MTACSKFGVPKNFEMNNVQYAKIFDAMYKTNIDKDDGEGEDPSK